MRTSTRTALHLARTALLLVLAIPSTQVTATDQTHDRGRESVSDQMGVIQREQRPVDPKHLPGWKRYCADNPERGGCEVILQRIGRNPVLGVLFAPDPAGGVRIAGVTPGGAAAGQGIKSGDRLLRIAGKPIPGNTPDARVENARRQLQALDENTGVELAYTRDGREHTVNVTPKLDERIMVFTHDGAMMRPGGNTAEPLRGLPRSTSSECKDTDAECRRQFEVRIERTLQAPGAVDMAHSSGFGFECGPGEICSMDHWRLAEAFRWSGVNLASLDAQLGRYFGTDTGVLVISTGAVLGQLQAGDVIQRVDGKAVTTPRGMMDVLRGKPADSTVAVDYLRDRQSASDQFKVPGAIGMQPLEQVPLMPQE